MTRSLHWPISWSSGTCRRALTQIQDRHNQVLDLSIVVVNWNVRDLLRRCLWSIDAAASQPISTETIVVDNASTDGSEEMLTEEFPQTRLLTNTSNLGYATACNQGLAQCRGRYVLFLNPDTEIVADAMGTMVRAMDARGEWAVLGPRLVYVDGSVQSSRRRFPSLLTAIFESTPLEAVWPSNSWARRYRMSDTPGDVEQEVDWVVGACLLCRSEAVRQVRGFDEEFFMYSEELDLCRRLRDAGWRVGYCPAAVVVHHEAKSSDQVPTARHIRFNTSKVRYFRKHHGRAASSFLRAVLLAFFLCQTVDEGLKWLVGHKRGLRGERVRSYLQVISSGLRLDGERR